MVDNVKEVKIAIKAVIPRIKAATNLLGLISSFSLFKACNPEFSNQGAFLTLQAAKHKQNLFNKIITVDFLFKLGSTQLVKWQELQCI